LKKPRKRLMTSLLMTLFLACGDKEEEQDTAVEEVEDTETTEDTEAEDTSESSDPVEEEDTAE